jgi:hypothetical protein
VAVVSILRNEAADATARQAAKTERGASADAFTFAISIIVVFVSVLASLQWDRIGWLITAAHYPAVVMLAATFDFCRSERGRRSALLVGLILLIVVDMSRGWRMWFGVAQVDGVAPWRRVLGPVPALATLFASQWVVGSRRAKLATQAKRVPVVGPIVADREAKSALDAAQSGMSASRAVKVSGNLDRETAAGWRWMQEVLPGLAGAKPISYECVPDAGLRRLVVQASPGKLIRLNAAEVASAWDVLEGQVTIGVGKSAAQLVVTARTVDRLAAAVFGWVRKVGASVSESVDVGVMEDGGELSLNFGTSSDAPHLGVLGKTGKGKTHVLKMIAADLVSRSDTMVIVVDFSADGAEFRPLGVDRVITTPAELRSLVAWLLGPVSARRMPTASAQFRASDADPQIVIIFEEMQTVISAYAGVDVDLSTLANTMRKFGVRLVFATQNGTNTMVPRAARAACGQFLVLGCSSTDFGQFADDTSLPKRLVAANGDQWDTLTFDPGVCLTLSGGRWHRARAFGVQAWPTVAPVGELPLTTEPVEVVEATVRPVPALAPPVAGDMVAESLSLGASNADRCVGALTLHGPLSNADLARELGVNPGTVHALMTRRAEQGLAAKDGAGRWMLTSPADF